MLKKRADHAFVCDRPTLSKRAASILAIVASAVVLLGAFFASTAQRNLLRIALGSPPSLEAVTVPAKVGKSANRNVEKLGIAEARRLNDAIPFSPGRAGGAKPFLSAGSITDRDRAADCLAIAAMAEAGASEEGQRAVIQVILNRVRHPAFAKTVCGVVFEGSHRSTGCQFTFTCDGALARRYTPTSWSLARVRAIEALDGRVYAPVSLATHYHTDWVHPYWSASLVKLARVDTHLFFRLPGAWGGPSSLSIAYRGDEPAMSQLAYLSAHADGARTTASNDFDIGLRSSAAPTDVVVRNEDGGAFLLLASTHSAESAREIGRNVCAGRSYCKVFGWFDRASIPSGYPVPPRLRANLGFSYFRSSAKDEIVLYDCSRFSNIAIENCLPRPVSDGRKLQTASKVEPIARSARAVSKPNAPAKSFEASSQRTDHRENAFKYYDQSLGALGSVRVVVG